VNARLEVSVTPGQPATVRAGSPGDPSRWAAGHAGELSRLSLAHGAVLIRGLGVTSAPDLAGIRAALGYQQAGLTEHFAERKQLAPGVYSAPDWAADREQCLHHEQGYGIDFPRVLLMACLARASTGGALLLGDTRTALGHLPAGLEKRFRADGWLLERSFRPHFGLQWPAAFGVSTPEEAESFCARRLIGCAWQPDGVLRAGQRRSAIIHHPLTGEACWFNDVAFFSRWSVDPEERQVLLSAFGADGLPFDTWFGDGEPITEEDWRGVLGAYDAVLYRADWRDGDVLLMDNILTAHGREPYQGRQEVAVAPAGTVPLTGCRPTVAPAAVRCGG
jgi:hypothetical protein